MARQQLKVIQMIWGALMVSQLLYLFVSFQKVKSAGPPEADVADWTGHPLLPVFAMVALTGIAAGILVPRLILKGQLKSSLQGRRPEFEKDVQVLFVPAVIRAALFETAGVFGLLMASFTLRMEPHYLFASVSLVAFVIFFPSETRLRDELEAAGA